MENQFSELKRLAAIRERLRENWDVIHIDKPVRDSDGPFRVGETLRIKVSAFIGNLRPEDVEVELYYGLLKTVDDMTSRFIQTMHVSQELGEGRFLYECQIPCKVAGRYGFTARVKPKEDDFIRSAPGLIKWAAL